MRCYITSIHGQGEGTDAQQEARSHEQTQRVQAFPLYFDYGRCGQGQQCNREGDIQHQRHIIHFCHTVRQPLVRVPNSRRSAPNDQNAKGTCNVTAHFRSARAGDLFPCITPVDRPCRLFEA